MANAPELTLTCDCGWNTRGSEQAVIEATQAHVRDVHWTEIDPEDVLELATTVAE